MGEDDPLLRRGALAASAAGLLGLLLVFLVAPAPSRAEDTDDPFADDGALREAEPEAEAPVSGERDAPDEEPPLGRAAPKAVPTKPADEEDEPEFQLPAPEVLAKLPIFMSTFAKTTVTFQNPKNRDKMDKWLPEAILGFVFFGRVHKMFGLTLGIIGLAEPKTPRGDEFTTGKFLDFLAVMQFEPHPMFNLWMGHLRVPSDRSAMSSAFFMPPWTFPGEATPGRFPVAPKTGTFAGISANNGGTLWGQFWGGHLKYYLGAYVQDPKGTPVTSARLNLDFLAPEPGYAQHSQYYGKKGDVLSLGISTQVQRYGSFGIAADGVNLMRADYRGGNVDFLLEKTLGRAGVLDIEGAYYLFNGKYEQFDYFWLAQMSYLLPFKLGIGRLQPVFRYQQMHEKAGTAAPETRYHVYDAQLSYVIMGDKIKAAVGYTRYRNDVSPGKGVFIGLQLMK